MIDQRLFEKSDTRQECKAMWFFSLATACLLYYAPQNKEQRVNLQLD